MGALVVAVIVSRSPRDLDTLSVEQSKVSVAAPGALASSAPGPDEPKTAEAVAKTEVAIAMPGEKLLPITSGQKDAEGFERVEWPGGKPHYEGEPVVAQVTTGDGKRKLHLEVNQLGEYPRVQVGPEERVNVHLQFQSSKPGMPLALAAQDGGALAGAKMSQRVDLNAQGAAEFAFTASANVGAHRVSIVTPKGEVKNLDFWVGELNTMRPTAQR